MLILVVGLTGAGKTTYCHNNMKLDKGILFSIDKMMKSFYWDDMPKNPNMKWFVENQKWYNERIQRCENFIKEQIVELKNNHLPIYLDLGFTSIKHRKEYIDLAFQYEIPVEIHFVDTDIETRWKRVQHRNKGTVETYVMEVTREMFDYIEEVFEDFNEEEKRILKKMEAIS